MGKKKEEKQIKLPASLSRFSVASFRKDDGEKEINEAIMVVKDKKTTK